MKRVLCITLAFVLLLTTFVGCGKKDTADRRQKGKAEAEEGAEGGRERPERSKGDPGRKGKDGSVPQCSAQGRRKGPRKGERDGR